MHILLIHQAFAAIDEPGGTRHHEMTLHLSEMGHKVTIIASPVSYLTGGAQQERIGWRTEQNGGENITIIRAYTYRALHKSFIHRVFSFLSFMVSSFLVGLRIKNVDLIWGTSPPIFQGVTAWLLARLKRAKFVFEIRDLWPAFAVAVGVLTNPLLIWLSEGLEKFLYKHADQLMVNSPGFIEHINSRGGKDLVLVPNGADAAMFNPESIGTEFCKEHGLGDKFVALYAGAHGMSNDLGVLLDAAKFLNEEAEICIVLLGDGKEKSRLVERAKEMNLTNLIFIPPVPKKDMGEALAAADACIAILKPIEMYKTVYPNKVFDYLAAGRAVVMAIDGVAREVVEKAEAGVFAQPGNAQAVADVIRAMAKERVKTKQMGKSGRAYLETYFDRGKLAKQLEELFQKTLI